jgi:hypothetical protein
MRISRNLLACSQSDWTPTRNASWYTEVLTPNHSVPGGLMPVVEGKRPEANLLVGSRQYALKPHVRCVVIYVG